MPIPIQSHIPNGGYGALPPGTRDAVETAKQAHWFVALFNQAWPVLIIVAGIIFAAGKVMGKIDTIIDTQILREQTEKEFRDKLDTRLGNIDSFVIEMRVWTARFDEKLANSPPTSPLPAQIPTKQKKPAHRKILNLF